MASRIGARKPRSTPRLYRTSIPGNSIDRYGNVRNFETIAPRYLSMLFGLTSNLR